jgi:hypothetical protein
MNTEVIKSVIRSILQILGILIVLNVPIPFIGPISNALTYILGEFDAVIAILNTLMGIGITLYGFFKDGNRFKDREIGAYVSKEAKSKGQKVEEFLYGK